LLPGAGEDLSLLSGDFRVFQRLDGHRWSLDDLVTAWYAGSSTNAPARVLDLGCGIGSVLLMLAWKFPEARLDGVEAQEISVELLRKSIAWNGVGERVTVRNADFRQVAFEPVFDLVSGTPPYFIVGDGVESPHVQRGPCRFEHRGGVEVYLDAMARALAPDGVGAVCAAAAHVGRVESAAAPLGLSIIARRAVIPREGKPPLINLYRVRRGQHALVDEPPLVVRDRQSKFTVEYDAIRAAMGMPVWPRATSEAP
jgi:tRNA1(Val) A37 N6-methylase TrmN6